MIDRKLLERQAAGLQRQHEAALATARQCEGALRMCQFLLAKLQNDERVAEAAAAASKAEKEESS